MRNKRVIDEARDIARAAELIRLDARLQVLESETRLSREKLLKLYKEIQGKSPPKGMLPFSTDWFTTWQPNIHASLFMSIYRSLMQATGIESIDAIVKGYKLYLEHCAAHDMEVALSVTRAWRLVKFFEARMLDTAECCKCHGHFVVHAYDLKKGYQCGLCNIPSRAGKTRARADGLAEAA